MANISKAERERRALVAATADGTATSPTIKEDGAAAGKESATVPVVESAADVVQPAGSAVVPEPEAKAKKAALVKMLRDDGMPGDVHPDEVENYRRGGWRLA